MHQQQNFLQIDSQSNCLPLRFKLFLIWDILCNLSLWFQAFYELLRYLYLWWIYDEEVHKHSVDQMGFKQSNYSESLLSFLKYFLGKLAFYLYEQFDSSPRAGLNLSMEGSQSPFHRQYILKTKYQLIFHTSFLKLSQEPSNKEFL